MTEIFLHEDFDHELRQNDIALLKTSNDFEEMEYLPCSTICFVIMCFHRIVYVVVSGCNNAMDRIIKYPTEKKMYSMFENYMVPMVGPKTIQR